MMRERMVARGGRLPDDVEPCVDLWLRAVEHRDGRVDAERVAERVRASFAASVVRFAVVDGDTGFAPTDRPAGFALTIASRVEAGAAVLAFIAVDPAAAGRGIGRALAEDAVAHARRAGFASLKLDVRTSNVRAAALYESLGFVPDGAPVPHALGGDPMAPYRLAL